MKDLFKIGFIGISALAPFAVFAANVENGLTKIGDLINQATPIIVALALLAFFWGLVTYIFQSGDAEKRKKGLSIMIWGVIALFVMLSIFGIINALQDTLDVGSGTVTTPTINTDTGVGTQGR